MLAVPQAERHALAIIRRRPHEIMPEAFGIARRSLCALVMIGQQIVIDAVTVAFMAATSNIAIRTNGAACGSWNRVVATTGLPRRAWLLRHELDPTSQRSRLTRSA